jgi:hypothetical protein
MALWERVLATAAAFSLVLAVPATDEIGFALTVIVVGLHVWRARAGASAEPAS